jgi:hypothetical protein
VTVELKPSILVSYAYRESWDKARHLGFWREVVYDSGAFTAHTTGMVIDRGAFLEWALIERQTNPLATEVFTLDVIGDWRASLRNTEWLTARGLDVIPIYHVGEPSSLLVALSRDYPKIALGGAVGYHAKVEWASLCFKAVWPKKIHGLGFGPAVLDRLPFDSIDFSTWNVGALKFGNYQSLGGAHIGRPQAGNYALPAEIAHQLNLEAKARKRWTGKMPWDQDNKSPSIRLVAGDGAAIMALAPPGTPFPRKNNIK